MDNLIHDFDSDNDSEAKFEEVDGDFENNVLKRTLGKFILHLRASSDIRQNNIDNILGDLKQIVSIYIRFSLYRVEEILENNGIELQDFVNIEEEVESINCTQDLDTRYKQDKYLERPFSMVKPGRYELGRRLIRHGTGTCGNDRPMKLQKDEMMIVPIVDVLTQWLKHDEFRDVLQQHVPEENVLSSVEDGFLYLNHAYFSQHKDAFRIILAFDEAQMCNQIGSKGGPKHNLGMIYWTLANIHPMYRSNLKFMNLPGIVTGEDIQRYGMNSILDPILKDIQRLVDGIEIENGEIIREKLLAICADNLDQHKLAGFKEGFTAAHPCIVCEASLYQARTLTTEDVNLIRTPKNYLRQVQEIENAIGAEKKRLSKLYGINRDTVLNQLEDVSPVVNISPDEMHNVLEGSLQREVQFYLRKICRIDRRITLEELNLKLQNFDYGYNELVCKPSQINLQHLTGNLHQSASQTWLLAVILPIILREIVEDDCEYSDNYSKMLEKSSIIMGHSISRGMIVYLPIYVAQYLSGFKRLYSNNVVENNIENVAMDVDNGNDEVVGNSYAENLFEHENENFESFDKQTFTSKQHMLTHSPRHFDKFGSLIQFWCTKVEAKHALLKNKAKCVHNAKNRPLTLANWHQVNQTFEMMQSLINDVRTGPRKLVLTETINFRHLYPENPTQFLVPWIKYNGTKYIARKCYIPIGYDLQESLPIFAELFSIVIEDNSPIFVCQSVEIIKHNMRLMAYKVLTNKNDFVKHGLRALVASNVYHSHISEEETYLIVKQNFGDLH